MMEKREKKLCLLVCQHMKGEVDAVLRAEHAADVVTAAFPARCGRTPLRLEELEQAIDNTADISQVELFCSCCADKLNLDQLPRKQKQINFHLHKMDQCFYLLASRDLVDNYLKARAYLVTPGWLANWQRHLENWGFAQDKPMAREFFSQHANRLVLLDTGIDAKSALYLKKFARWVDRPYDIVPIGLDYLRLFLTKIILEWRLEKVRKEARQKPANSDYAMAMDLLTDLTQTVNETETIQKIFQMFLMLFAPGELAYVPITEGTPGKAVCFSPTQPDNDVTLLIEQAKGFDGEYQWTGSGKGFWIRITCHDETCGVLKVEGIAFPEYKEHYLNLSLTIARVCGLAIANARKYQQILEQKNQLSDTLKTLEKKEAQLRISLREKEALLQEIHHRVKNNMMVISSLLNLQASAQKDPVLADILTQTRSRIRSMAMVHECVYHSKDLASVDFNIYVKEIANSLLMTSNLLVGKIQLNIDVRDIFLEVKQAIPCGLIINELLTNAIKHAFPGQEDKKGILTVAIHPTEFGNIKLIVKDNGCGLPKEIDVSTTQTMGLRLVSMMVKQLKGRLQVDRENGTEFTVRFPGKPVRLSKREERTSR